MPTIVCAEHVVGVGLPLQPGKPDPLHHAIGDDSGRRERREPAGERTVAGHDGHEEERHAGSRRDRHGRRCEQRARGVLPGPIVDSTKREEEEHDRQDARYAPAEPHRPPGDALERPVASRHAEEQRDADERDEERRRKPFENRLRRDMPPRSTPTSHASARQTMPTLIVVASSGVPRGSARRPKSRRDPYIRTGLALHARADLRATPVVVTAFDECHATSRTCSSDSRRRASLDCGRPAARGPHIR